MRWGIIFSLLTVSVWLVAPAALGQDEPLWALISTEVDDGLDGAGTFMDREVLQLFPPLFPWSWDVNDVFFDPGDVFGIETGLDAFHVQHGQPADLYYFSTEVDFDFEGQAYEDEDLLVYDTSTGLVNEAFDVKDVMGADYGLDAACWFFDEVDARWMLLFSTEVGGTALIDGVVETFTDGDILVTDGSELIGWLNVQEVFGRNVGLDALHVWLQEEEPEQVELFVMFSTEVDGVVRDLDGDPGDNDPLIDFKDQDLLIFQYAMNDGPGALLRTELAWQGIEDGFGKDVGLDAVYVEPIPEPATMLLVGLGFGALALRYRRKR